MRHVRMLMMVALAGLLVSGVGCTPERVREYVCPACACPAPTVDEAIDVLIDAGISEILGGSAEEE